MAEAGLIFLGVVLWLVIVFLMMVWLSLPPEDKKFKPTPTKTKVDIQA